MNFGKSRLIIRDVGWHEVPIVCMSDSLTFALQRPIFPLKTFFPFILSEGMKNAFFFLFYITNRTHKVIVLFLGG